MDNSIKNNVSAILVLLAKGGEPRKCGKAVIRNDAEYHITAVQFVLYDIKTE